MTPDSSSAVGAEGGIAKSGKTIYDSLQDSPDYFLAGGDLESILREGLVGLDLNYPLRTRSKVLKSKSVSEKDFLPGSAICASWLGEISFEQVKKAIDMGCWVFGPHFRRSRSRGDENRYLRN